MAKIVNLQDYFLKLLERHHYFCTDDCQDREALAAVLAYRVSEDLVANVSLSVKLGEG